LDNSKIIKDITYAKYDYVLCFGPNGPSEIFNELLLNKIAKKYIYFDIASDLENWSKKTSLKGNELIKNEKKIDLYTFQVTWPHLKEIYEKYYGKKNIDTYHSLYLLPHNFTISYNKKGAYLFDLVITGKSDFDFIIDKNLQNLKIAILYGKINNKFIKTKLEELNKLKNIYVFPQVNNEMYKKIILLSRIVYLPINPKKVNNSFSLATSISLGKCIVTHKGISTRPYNLNNNLIFINSLQEIMKKNLFNKNSYMKYMMKKNYQFALKHFNLTNFFIFFLTKYF
jgi:hypothetical protein